MPAVFWESETGCRKSDRVQEPKQRSYDPAPWLNTNPADTVIEIYLPFRSISPFMHTLLTCIPRICATSILLDKNVILHICLYMNFKQSHIFKTSSCTSRTGNTRIEMYLRATISTTTIKIIMLMIIITIMIIIITKNVRWKINFLH